MLDNIFSKIWKSKNHSVNVTKVINNRGLIFFLKDESAKLDWMNDLNIVLLTNVSPGKKKICNTYSVT